MNILHHKSWHVRTKKNIERVRRDEEKAAEEEKEKQRKIALAEQEARTDLLRSRSKNKLKSRDRDEIDQGSSTDVVPSPSSTVTGHGNINFFKEIEDGLRKQGINEEHAKEKKVEKEKWERSVGLLTYLGKSNIEEQNETPWYLSGRKRKRDDMEEGDKRDFRHLKEEKKKANLDPLLEMREYVHKKKKKKHKEKKDKKHNKRERERIKSLPKPSTGKTIEQLRNERLKREQAEKNRTAELFSKLKGDDSKNSSESEEEDRSRKYNSQYNPELSRKYKKHKPNDYS